MLNEAITRTRAVPTKILRFGKGYGESDSTLYDASCVDTASSKSWTWRDNHTAIKLDNLFQDEPNGMMIHAGVLSGADNSAFAFNVWVYQDKNCCARRVCSVTATLGKTFISVMVDGTSAIPSGAAAFDSNCRYADTFAVTDFWGTGVTTVDAGGGDGIAGLYFDLRGAKYIAIEQTSALDNGKVWFEGNGW